MFLLFLTAILSGIIKILWSVYFWVMLILAFYLIFQKEKGWINFLLLTVVVIW